MPKSGKPDFGCKRGRGPHEQAETLVFRPPWWVAPCPAGDVRSRPTKCDSSEEDPMKAVYIEKFGGPDVLRYGDVPDPVPAPGQVVVDVHAASVNGADWKVRVGDYKQTKFPLGLGRDFSGVVAAAGDGADLKAGDAVFGVLDAGQEGAYAEKLAEKASIIATKPDQLAH